MDLAIEIMAPVQTWEGLVADHLREMAAGLLSAHSGAYRPGSIAYLTGESYIWGMPSLWPELPIEVRDLMKRAACDLAFGEPGAERPAAEALVQAADMLAQFAPAEDAEIELDPNDYSLTFAAEHRGEVA